MHHTSLSVAFRQPPLNGVNMNQYHFFFQTPNLFKYIKKEYVKYFHLRYVITFIFVFCIFQKMILYQKMRVQNSGRRVQQKRECFAIQKFTTPLAETAKPKLHGSLQAEASKHGKSKSNRFICSGNEISGLSELRFLFKLKQKKRLPMRSDVNHCLNVTKLREDGAILNKSARKWFYRLALERN